MELTMGEGVQTYLKAGKTKKSVMLDDFCEEAGYCRRHAARVLHQAGQRYVLGWTEAGAVRTKAEIYVVAALESCLRR
jgi:hypothetical protein